MGGEVQFSLRLDGGSNTYLPPHGFNKNLANSANSNAITGQSVDQLKRRARGGIKKDSNKSSSIVVIATDKTFQREVIDASKSGLVIVDFSATWCGPCQKLKPVLDKIARKNAGKAKIVRIETNAVEHMGPPYKNWRTFKQYSKLLELGYPRLIAFKNGKPVNEVWITESGIQEYIDSRTFNVR